MGTQDYQGEQKLYLTSTGADLNDLSALPPLLDLNLLDVSDMNVYQFNIDQLAHAVKRHKNLEFLIFSAGSSSMQARASLIKKIMRLHPNRNRLLLQVNNPTAALYAGVSMIFSTKRRLHF